MKTSASAGADAHHEINELMDFDLPENADFDTIGGFVLFRRIWPRAIASRNDYVAGFRQVTVLEASRRRVNRVRLSGFARKCSKRCELS